MDGLRVLWSCEDCRADRESSTYELLGTWTVIQVECQAYATGYTLDSIYVVFLFTLVVNVLHVVYCNER